MTSMEPEPKSESLWSSASDEGPEQEALSGLELAEMATSPASFEEVEPEGESFDSSSSDAAFTGAASEEGQPHAEARNPDGEEAATATMAAAARRRGRGGRPRVTAEQDQRILEVFEQAKKEGRSLKDAAQQLASELGQPADYINQRYYYLQRRQGGGAPAARQAAGGRRRQAAAAQAPAAAAAPAAGGRRRGRGAAAREAAAAPVAAEAAPAPQAQAPAAAAAAAAVPAAALSAVEQRLAELSDIATRQLAALTERIERIEERLRSLEQAPRRAAAVGDEELYSRLGRVLVRAAFGALEQGR